MERLLRRARPRPAGTAGGRAGASGGRAGASGGRTGRLALALAVALTLALLGARAASGEAETKVAPGSGLIYGSLYTAQNIDSIVPGRPIVLVFRAPDGTKSRQEVITDGNGRFSFPALATDPKIAYVLLVKGATQDYLSAPLHFEEGHDQLLFNFVLPGPLPPGTPRLATETGRPSPPPASPAACAAPAKANSELRFLAIILAAGVVFFLLWWLWIRRRSTGKSGASA
jgi:hypothetical protein